MLVPSHQLVRGAALKPKRDTETLYHVTLLSNFVRAYDKYSRIYSKTRLPRSTFPDKFFLLSADELAPGIQKSQRLLRKLGLPGDRCIALVSEVPSRRLRENTRTGIGRYIPGGDLEITGVAWIDDGLLCPIPLEEAAAEGHRIGGGSMHSFNALQPRSFSVLPIAQGCQASCSFCFSSASISAEQKHKPLDLERVAQLANEAKERGAIRFVITGGGEPGLVEHTKLCELISVGSEALGKSVLITNGYHLSKASDTSRSQMLEDYYNAGLRVLSISRHHHLDDKNKEVMNLHTNTQAIMATWRAKMNRWTDLKLRLICVLQSGAIDSLEEVERYVSWAAEHGVSEICFKELYVSTSTESVYHAYAANQWSRDHQVSLRVILRFAERHKFEQVAALPWGAPIFAGVWNGKKMQIAAYTEPSLYWERSHGIARSWNQLSDGRCFASLEDRASEVQ